MLEHNIRYPCIIASTEATTTQHGSYSPAKEASSSTLRRALEPLGEEAANEVQRRTRVRGNKRVHADAPGGGPEGRAFGGEAIKDGLIADTCKAKASHFLKHNMRMPCQDVP